MHDPWVDLWPGSGWVKSRGYHTWARLYQRVQKLVLKCGSDEPNIQIKLILNQKYCMNEIRVNRTFLGSGSFEPNIWVLLPFLDPNIGTWVGLGWVKTVPDPSWVGSVVNINGSTRVGSDTPMGWIRCKYLTWVPALVSRYSCLLLARQGTTSLQLAFMISCLEWFHKPMSLSSVGG